MIDDTLEKIKEDIHNNLNIPDSYISCKYSKNEALKYLEYSEKLLDDLKATCKNTLENEENLNKLYELTEETGVDLMIISSYFLDRKQEIENLPDNGTIEFSGERNKAFLESLNVICEIVESDKYSPYNFNQKNVNQIGRNVNKEEYPYVVSTEEFEKFITGKYQHFCNETELISTDENSIKAYLDYEFSLSSENSDQLEGYKPYISELDVFTEENITFDRDAKIIVAQIASNYEENVIRQNLGLELKEPSYNIDELVCEYKNNLEDEEEDEL